jgi:hypothetical protein
MLFMTFFSWVQGIKARVVRRMCTHYISIAQQLDTTGEGIAEFRIEIAVSGAFEDISSSYVYSQCGVDEEGRELYVSPWLNLKSVLEEVNRISSELKSQGKDFAVSRDMRSRVVDALQE